MKVLSLIFAMLALSFSACGGGETSTRQLPVEPMRFAQKISFFPSIADLEANNQSVISFTFSTSGTEEIFVEVNNMAMCSSNDASCAILVNNGDNDLRASGDFFAWTGGLAFVQCALVTSPFCTVNLQNSGNFAIGLSAP